MSQLIFTLSMPHVASWNGRWSGEGNLYAIVKNFKTLKEQVKAKQLLEQGSWYYRWPDGWGASISVREGTPAEVKKTRKLSKGFLSYDWMIESILQYNKIYASHEEPSKQ